MFFCFVFVLSLVISLVHQQVLEPIPFKILWNLVPAREPLWSRMALSMVGISQYTTEEARCRIVSITCKLLLCYCRHFSDLSFSLVLFMAALCFFSKIMTCPLMSLGFFTWRASSLLVSEDFSSQLWMVHNFMPKLKRNKADGCCSPAPYSAQPRHSWWLKLNKYQVYLWHLQERQI